jgi:hypothetical protein
MPTHEAPGLAYSQVPNQCGEVKEAAQDVVQLTRVEVESPELDMIGGQQCGQNPHFTGTRKPPRLAIQEQDRKPHQDHQKNAQRIQVEAKKVERDAVEQAPEGPERF